MESITTARDCVGIGMIDCSTIIVLGGTNGAVGVEGAKKRCLSVVEISYIVHTYNL